MDSLIFSLKATIPVFSMMILGMAFKKCNIINDQFASSMNRFVFLVALPVLVFLDLVESDFKAVWDSYFVLYCFGVTLLSILLVFIFASLLGLKETKGEFIQVSYRSSAALLGIALMQNIYGNATYAPLMIIGSVPLYNVMAVFVLLFFKPNKEKITFEMIKKTCLNVIKNPIIIGIILGMIYSLLELPLPYIFNKTLSSVASTASPLGLIAMGASFSFDQIKGQLKPLLSATFIKLCLFVILFLPVAIKLGFRNEKLIAILVMLGSSSTVSCFVMAKNMGHKGELTSGVVMLTTLLCGFTITLWLLILKTYGYI